jgi:hypothetical protein
MNKATKWRSPLLMGTLSMVYAEAGRMDDARRIGEKAIRLAKAQGDQRLAAGIRQQLSQYSSSASQQKQKQ